MLSAASRLSSTTSTRRPVGTAATAAGGGGALLAGRLRHCADARQRHAEQRPLPMPSLCASTRALVQLDQALHQRQADAQAALAAVERALALHEQLEDVRQQLRRRCRCRCRARRSCASPSLGAQRRARCCPPRGVYLAALLSRLATTCARRAKSPYSQTGARRAPRPTELLALRVDQRPRGLDAVRDRPCASSTGSFFSTILPWVMRETSSRSSTSRARWRHLALDRRRAPTRCAASVGADAAHHLDRVADRRERVAQLVREHREELVLAPVRLLQLLLGLRGARSRAAGSSTGARSRARSRRGSTSSSQRRLVGAAVALSPRA